MKRTQKATLPHGKKREEKRKLPETDIPFHSAHLVSHTATHVTYPVSLVFLLRKKKT